jgi:superfamily II DNA or RNA helicase
VKAELHYGHAHTRVVGPREAVAAVRHLLTVDDPNKWRSPKFRSGEWDGKHRFYRWQRRTRTLSYPTGLTEWLIRQAEEDGLTLTARGVPPPAPRPTIPPDYLDGITLRPYQLWALRRALPARRGVLKLSPRSGKTEIQIAVAKYLGVPSVLLVHSQHLLEQHYERFRARGLTDVGRYGRGHRELSAQHVIAMVQTLSPRLRRQDPTALRFLASRELLQSDEAHHLSAASWRRIFRESEAPWRYAYSGTPLRARGGSYEPQDLRLIGAAGPLLVDVGAAYLRDLGYLAPAELYMIPLTEPKVPPKLPFPTVYREGIVEHAVRNALVLQTVRSMVQEQRRVLVLVTQVRHGLGLLEAMAAAGLEPVLSIGGRRKATLRDGARRWSEFTAEDLARFRSGERPILIGTTVFDEGVDFPWLDGLVNAGGQKSSIATLQRTFRALTPSDGKRTVRVVDFFDRHHRWLRDHSKERESLYRAEELPVTIGAPARGGLP